MTHRTFLRIVVLLTVALAVGSGRPRVGLSAHQSSQTQATVPAGQTRTRLADGRVLIVGGDGALGSASVWDPTTQTATPTTGSLIVPRAWHTATLLSDGTVLIAGGRNGSGTIGAVEIFDPASGLFAQIAMAGAVARADHTATLLLDGRVLIVGGIDGTGDVLPIEIWDLAAQSSTVVGSSGVDRQDQRATLASDGTVLLTGGKTLDGKSNVPSLVIDPSSGNVSNASALQTDVVPSKLSASIPQADATDVDAGMHVALRFSEPVAMASVTSDHVNLTGPNGLVNAAIVTAEDGRLVFVWPDGPLADGAAYTVTASGLTDQSGGPVVSASFQFTTKTQPSNKANNAEREAWTPNPLDGEHGWLSNRPPSPWESLAPLIAAPGITAVSGRVLKLDGAPLKDVTLAIEGHAVRTDASGRFLLPLAPWTSRLTTLAIDARTANKPSHIYGFYEARIGVYAGKTNVLPFTIWSPLIDTAHQVTIPSPTAGETLVTTPTMPGLELHLPAGTVIQDEDHRPARTVSLTPIPLDRTPFPLPDNATFSMFFTIQPGGAYLSTPGPIKGGWLVYPNIRHSRTGSRVQFFNYDPDDKGWYPYGMGTITGPSVVPDAKTRIYGFTGASFNDGTPTPPAGPPPGECPCAANDGDPVNLATGIFKYEMTDLVVPDVMPLVLTRSYNSQDPYNRAFGTGMSNSFGLFEQSQSWPAQADLYLPDGGKIHFDRISDPSLQTYQTVFEHTTTPTGFFKAHMTFWGDPLNDSAQGWQVALPDGTVYVFPHAGSPLQAIRDRHGNEIRLTWTSGLLQRVTSPNGRWIAFTYGTGGRVSQAIDNLGRTVGYTYDANGNLVTVTDPEGHISSYGWTTNNQLASVKPRNLYGTQTNLVTNTYTAAADAPTPIGWIKTQTHADGGVYQFAYTVSNGVSTQTTVTDPRGYVRQVTFNSVGYTLSDTHALNQPEQQTTTSTRPGSDNFIATVADAILAQTAYVRDTFGNATSITRCTPNQTPCTDTSPGSLTTRYTYDPRYQDVATITDPLNHTTVYSYDNSGNLTSVADALQHQTTFAYNSQGQVTSVTDPLQHTTTFAYTRGDLTSVTDPLSRITTRFVDEGGRLLSTTTPLGETTRYSYGANNEVQAVVDALGNNASVTYFPDGQVQSVVDPNQHTTTFGYDSMGRLTSRTDPLQRSETFSYDLSGNPDQWLDRKGQQTTRTFDSLNRLHQITYNDQSTITYTYDGRDRMVQINDSVSGSISRAYDDFDRMTLETTPEGSVGYTYDDAGRRETMTAGGQPGVSYVFDAADRLTQITSGASTIAMTYDDGNRRSSVLLPNNVLADYNYDAADQIITIDYGIGGTSIGNITYAYDAGGHRISVGGTWARTGLPQSVAGASYDAANELIMWGPQTQQYDRNGSVASDGLTSYVWDAREHLATVTGSSSSQFSYDSTGRRITTAVAGVTTQYGYDGVNVVARTTGSQTNTLIAGVGFDQWLGRIDQNGPAWFLTDALGSIVAVSDSGGALTAQYTYEPFGRTATQGTAADAFAFTGREGDGADSYFYRARYYRPTEGRFLSEDEIGISSPATLYAYVDDDPVAYTDPLGLFKVCCRAVKSMADTMCHCWIGLSDGHTIGAYREWGTLTRRSDYKDDKPTPAGSCCKDYGGGKPEDDQLKAAWNREPMVTGYWFNSTSNTAVSEAVRTMNIVLPPCAQGRRYYWDVLAQRILPTPR